MKCLTLNGKPSYIIFCYLSIHASNDAISNIHAVQEYLVRNEIKTPSSTV